MQRSEEDAINERNILFPNTDVDEFVLVCEDCFAEIMSNAYRAGDLINEKYKDYLGDQ